VELSNKIHHDTAFHSPNKQKTSKQQSVSSSPPQQATQLTYYYRDEMCDDGQENNDNGNEDDWNMEFADQNSQQEPQYSPQPNTIKHNNKGFSTLNIDENTNNSPYEVNVDELIGGIFNNHITKLNFDNSRNYYSTRKENTQSVNNESTNNNNSNLHDTVTVRSVLKLISDTLSDLHITSRNNTNIFLRFLTKFNELISVLTTQSDINFVLPQTQQTFNSRCAIAHFITPNCNKFDINQIRTINLISPAQSPNPLTKYPFYLCDILPKLITQIDENWQILHRFAWSFICTMSLCLFISFCFQTSRISLLPGGIWTKCVQLPIRS
jgi:hypothetical protein